MGIAFGAWAGFARSGLPGSVAGALAGGFLGWAIGRLPVGWAVHRLMRDLSAKSSEELLAYLHSPGCLTPNYILLILQERGEDVQQELPAVLEMLESADFSQRSRGWAALASAFPELAARLSDYSVSDSMAECQRKSLALRREVAGGLERVGITGGAGTRPVELVVTRQRTQGFNARVLRRITADRWRPSESGHIRGRRHGPR